MRGTDIMMSGFTLEKASATIFGEGIRVRKCMCIPLRNSKITSNCKPYMCAIGSMEITFMPAVR